MPQDLKSALQSWKEADANARAAESLLRDAWTDFEARRADAIPGELVKQVAQLRSTANDHLKTALKLLKPERPRLSAEPAAKGTSRPL